MAIGLQLRENSISNFGMEYNHDYLLLRGFS